MYSCILISSSIYSCIFNYQPGSNVQLVIQQYIELPASRALTGCSKYCLITSCTVESGWLFNIQPNILPAVYSQLIVQYTAELLAVHRALSGSSIYC